MWHEDDQWRRLLHKLWSKDVSSFRWMMISEDKLDKKKKKIENKNNKAERKIERRGKTC